MAVTSLGWGGLARRFQELIFKAYDFLATLRLGTVLLCSQSLACLLPRRGGDHGGRKVTQQGRHRVDSIGPAKPVRTQEGRLPSKNPEEDGY